MLSSKVPALLLGVALVSACSAQSSTASSGSSSSSGGVATDPAWDALFAEKTSPPSDLKTLPGLWVGTVDQAEVRARITTTQVRFGMKCDGAAFGITFDYQLRAGSSSGSSSSRIVIPAGTTASLGKCKLEARVGEGSAQITDGRASFNSMVWVTGTDGYSAGSYFSLTKVAD
jgi:hypothetical protein